MAEASKQLELKNPCNIIKYSNQASIINYGSQLIGRENYNGWRHRIERYTFNTTEVISKLELKFTDSPSSAIFSKYDGSNIDYRTYGVGVHISLSNQLEADFDPANAPKEDGLLTYQNSNKELVGTINLSTSPLEANKTYYIFLYVPTDKETFGCVVWAPKKNDKDYFYPNTEGCVYESYTVPTSPSSFDFSGNILSTGFTVEWGKPTSSDNNPVTGYELFLNGNSIKTVDKNTTSYSYKFTKEQDFQGENITVSIRTVGTADSAKYSEMKEISGRVNTRPPKPILSKNYSGNGFYEEGTVVITILNSQDTDKDNDPISYQYKIGTNGTWIDVDNLKVEKTLTDTTTFKFRAYDNKEYSNETSLAINKYTLGIIEKGRTENGYGIEEITYNVTGKCQVIASYKDEKDKKTKEKTLDFNSGNNTINLITELGFSQTEIKLTFYPKDSDGMVLSLGDNGFQTAELGKTPAMPTIDSIEVFDQYGDSNIINSDSYHCFYKKVRIKIPKFDSRIFTWDAFVYFDGVEEEAEKIDSDSDYFYLQAEFGEVASVKDEKELKVKLGNYDFNLGIYHRIIKFPFSGLKSNNMGELVYTINDDNKPAPLRVSFSCDTSELEQSYGLKEIEGKWQLQILYGNNKTLTKTNLTPDTKTLLGTGYLSWGKIFTENDFEKLGISTDQYGGTKTFTVTVGVTNAYGETIDVSCEQIYDFNKVPELTYFSFEFQDDNGELKSPGDGYNFVEGMTIRATYRIKKWQAGKIAFEIQTNNGKTTLFSFDDISHNSLSGLESPEISKEFEIPKITKTETWNLCLYNKKVSRSVGTAYNTFPVNDKSVSLTGFDYSHNDNEAGTYTLKSFTLSSAAEGQLAYSLIFAENEEPYPIGDNNTVIIPDNDGNPLAPSEDGSGKDSVIGSLLITETVTNSGYTLTKKWYSNTVVIYSIVPTISYRKNRVGINTQGLDKELDSVFYVQRAGDGKYVTFATMTDEGIQGEIIFSLLDGSVAGMTIDCGSW